MLCDLMTNHAGEHVDYDIAGRVRNRWRDAAFKRCYKHHPSDGGIVCTLFEGHPGAHIDIHTVNRTSWVDVAVVAIEGDDSLAVAEITLENEIGDNSDLLEWARSRNPKMFKTAGRDVASPLCQTANKEQHQKCTEPWCDCPCHDMEGANNAAKSKRKHLPWGICLGLLIVFLGRGW